MRARRKHKGLAGFTLLEMSIVLVIVGLMATGGLAVLSSTLDRKQVEATATRLAALEEALLNYRRAFDRLPCPADITLAPTSASFGIEAATAGTCTGGSPAATFDAGGAGGPVGGAVPVRTLGLPDDVAFDGFRRRILYVVDTRATYTAETASAANYKPAFETYAVDNATIGNIVVKDASGGNRATQAVYALVSFGRNGHGAYPYQGGATRIDKGSTNADELENCECDSSGASGTFDATFVQKPFTGDDADPLAIFDDVVAFKLRSDLMAKYE